MKDNKNDVILSGVHMDLSEDVKIMVNEKTQRLFAHEGSIIRIRIEISRCQNTRTETEFEAKGHIEIKGNPLIASVQTTDVHKSIDELIDKLDRMLRRRSRLKKVKRKQTHEVDIPADIPKAVSA